MSLLNCWPFRSKCELNVKLGEQGGVYGGRSNEKQLVIIKDNIDSIVELMNGHTNCDN